MELLKEIKNLLHGKDDLQNSLDRIIKDNKYSTKGYSTISTNGKSSMYVKILFQ